MSGHRDRSSGWKYAKISGHDNEGLVCEQLRTYKKTQDSFVKSTGLPNMKIANCDCGGLCEKNVPSVLKKGRPTKNKADLNVELDSGLVIGVSLKKSLSGQVYLITVENFIEGMELQYKIKIPGNVKRAIRLFWGSANDIKEIVNQHSTNTSIKKYELHKNRLTARTLKAYDESLHEALIQWFKDNIYNITDFCFARGLALNEGDRAALIWYKNMLGENDVDEVIQIKKLCAQANNNKKMIQFGAKGGGTTISLPFGFVQWHQGSMQFHHQHEKITSLYKQ